MRDGQTLAVTSSRWRLPVVRVVAAVLVSAASLCACGGSGSGSRASTAVRRAAAGLKSPCQARARAVVAHAFGLGETAVSARMSIGNNASPQCTYAQGRRSIVVNVDTGPQPYFILERTAVEAAQQFATVRTTPLPVHVGGIGLDAFWFPAASQFMTTDGVRLVAVTVTVPGARQARLSALGKAVARPYLGKLVQPPGFSG
jgi:hypothetical protein